MPNPSNTSDTAVLIPALGNLNHKFQSYSFYLDNPAFVPVNSRSTLSLLLDFYLQENIDIYIAVHPNQLTHFQHELSYYQNQIHWIPIQQSNGVNHTLQQALPQIPQNQIIVNLVSTIPHTLPQSNQVLIDTHTFQHNLYSGIAITPDNQLQFKPKATENHFPAYAFQGLFQCNKSSLIDAANQVENPNDLLLLIQTIHQNQPLQAVKSTWLDTGHEINYPKVRKNLIASRSFNAISINPDNGILRKTSQNKEKLQREAQYIQELPTNLQIFYPRILNNQTHVGYFEMEYYGYPNLSEYQLYRNLNPQQWEVIFQQLHYFIKTNASHAHSLTAHEHQQFFWEKNLKRITQYLETLPPNHPFLQEELNINQIPCLGFYQLQQQTQVQISQAYNPNYHSIMHGDLCFNNILYDTFSETLKTIDPRGGLNDQTMELKGDIRYDVAKLTHSASGHYDYMVNNLFQLSIHQNTIRFSFPLRPNHHILRSSTQQLVENLNLSHKEIQLFTALLFLSMPPMHSENPKRQEIMFAQGLLLLNQSLT